MNILIAYATVEGQTRKISEFLANHIESRGHHVALLNVIDKMDFALERPDAVILCAPIHAAQYSQPFMAFIHEQHKWLDTVPNAFVSVSLMIESENAEEVEEARTFPDRLWAETGWTPQQIHHAAGALKFTQYDFFKRWMMRRMATRQDMPFEPGKDREFTDWQALMTFADTFLWKASAPQS
jgi:menaquinone-dependent protoporphyrinogen oxidase